MELNELIYRLDNIKNRLLTNPSILNNKYLIYPIIEEYEYILNNSEENHFIAHETIKLKYNNQYIDIDKKIAPLITEIWKAGFKTNNSCQNNVPRGYIWISFNDSIDMKKFINIIFQGKNNKEDIIVRGLDSPCYTPNSWKYKIDIYNLYEPVDNIFVNCSIRFPFTDLKYVYKKILHHNIKN